MQPEYDASFDEDSPSLTSSSSSETDSDKEDSDVHGRVRSSSASKHDAGNREDEASATLNAGFPFSRSGSRLNEYDLEGLGKYHHRYTDRDVLESRDQDQQGSSRYEHSRDPYEPPSELYGYDYEPRLNPSKAFRSHRKPAREADGSGVQAGHPQSLSQQPFVPNRHYSDSRRHQTQHHHGDHGRNHAARYSEPFDNTPSSEAAIPKRQQRESRGNKN